MRHSIVFKVTLFGVGCGLGALIFFISAFIQGGAAATQCVAVSLYPIYAPSADYLAGLPIWMFEIFTVLLLTAGELRRDIARSGPYRFTRQRSRVRWYAQKSLLVQMAGALFPLVYAATLALGLAILTGCGRTAVDWDAILRLCALHVVCAALFYALLALACGLLALKLNVNTAIIAVLAAVSGLLIAGIVLSGSSAQLAVWAFRLNPACISIASWRSIPGYGFEAVSPALGLTIIPGLVAQCVQLVLAELIGLKLVMRIDIIADTAED